MAKHPHIFIAEIPDPHRFTSPNSGPRDRMGLPARDRATHAGGLLTKLENASDAAAARAAEQRAHGIQEGMGIYLTFESEPNFNLKFESLDLAGSGIELCAVKTTPDNRTQATVFVPDGKLAIFLKKVAAYRDEHTRPRTERGEARPKNQDLVESISDIRIAVLEALWTETEVPFPDIENVITWEAWLRRDDGLDHLGRLRARAAAFDLEVGGQSVTFVDRKVILVRGTAINLSRSVEILAAIAELRLPSTTAAFFTEMTGIEQQAWVDDLTARLTAPPLNAPYVCILDTGVSHGHPLLNRVAAPADMHSYRPAWGTHDWKDHGTPMAGLAVFGDLTQTLSAVGPVALTHYIESIKIVDAAEPHDVELYGAVTQESVYRVEVIPDRSRVYCMAVTAPDGRDRGRPSSWSAAIDALASGAEDSVQRLIILSAGNTAQEARRFYPNSNFTDGIHDPAQAWNALTVGGYTDKALIDPVRNPGWEPLAARGDLSPCSCTSLTWEGWPIKPDIVMEAGNMGQNLDLAEPDYIDTGLQLLSASRSFGVNRPLTSFGDTSAATALAAKYAAVVLAKYPNLRPETVRGLLVHSSAWTPQMIARFTEEDGSINYAGLLRCFGYGTPNLVDLLSSLDNSLTLVVQSELQPFFKDEADKNRMKTREMRVHPLPWPVEALNGLGNTEVTMRVTLSYFVEPSPGARGWTPKYGYQSHGLRFAVRNPLESEVAFERRINRFGREEDYVAPGIADPGWRFGRAMRSLTSLGSIHSDIWNGKAVNLASRGSIAVYPTIGWWNKRPHLNGWQKSARYSLIVTIATPEVETDIYTPVANQVGIPVVIEG